MGSHVEFQTWWFWFHAFATIWKFVGAVGKTPNLDLPSSKSASLAMTAELQDKQKVVKKHNAIAFANLTMALDSPSLIGMLMRAHNRGLASKGTHPVELVVKEEVAPCKLSW